MNNPIPLDFNIWVGALTLLIIFLDFVVGLSLALSLFYRSFISKDADASSVVVKDVFKWFKFLVVISIIWFSFLAAIH